MIRSKTRPVAANAYCVTAMVLGGFAATLAATAICYAAGLDRQTRDPIEVAASIAGLCISGAVAMNHWNKRGTRPNLIWVLTITWLVLACAALAGMLLGGTP